MLEVLNTYYNTILLFNAIYEFVEKRMIKKTFVIMFIIQKEKRIDEINNSRNQENQNQDRK